MTSNQIVSNTEWQETQVTEAGFWGACVNTLGEELKQLTYLSRMGFSPYHNGNSPFNFTSHGRSILDIGGGPISTLLKFEGPGRKLVVDPCGYPQWVYDRYKLANIEFRCAKGEDLNEEGWDVVLMYNVLQHTQDPERIIKNAMKAGTEFHMFEWVNIPAHPGHPHQLTRENLDKWTGRKGVVEDMHGENQCMGECWYI